MTPTNFATYVRQQTKTNSTTFTDAEILILMNAIKDELSAEVLNVNEDYFGVEMTRDLEAGKRNYAFDSEILSQMKYLMAKLDGTNWTTDPLVEYDIAQLKINTDESSITSFFSTNRDVYKNGYFLFGNEIILLNDTAITLVSSGLKLWLIVYPADFTTLTGSTDMSVRTSATSVGFPRQLHKILADKVVVAFKQGKDKPLPLTLEEKQLPNRLEVALNAMKSQNLSRSYQGTIAYDDGSDY